MVDVLIMLGSESDMAIAEKAKKALDELGIPNEIKVASAHRAPELVDKIVRESDAKVFIGIAGLSAALPGVIASKTKKPVIGVPVDVKLGGLDALLSIAQIPSGVPVAAVGIDNGKNAALLAARILALSDRKLAEKLEKGK
ncbi:MAG: 5-(carboxyamino)imidazole ribonucleotide mutase [Candidatus Micrarchaeota archaeon]|nr:5-(carboxyamino)imidazole ribonucleotide mutase [Candidatus Micrarchaeota archaeon]